MLQTSLSVLTPATSTVLDVAALKEQLRIIDDDTQAALISDYIIAATEYIESQTIHVAYPTQFYMTLDRWPYLGVDGYLPFSAPVNGVVVLPRGPLISVDEIKYIDTNGTLQVLDPSAYLLDTACRPGRIWPQRLQYWPITDPTQPNGVQIKFTAGYSNASRIPARYRQALRFLVSHWHENRVPTGDTAGEIPTTMKSLINNLKLGYYR